MKKVIWLYCGAIIILCAFLSIALEWFASIYSRSHPGTLLPWHTHLLVKYHSLLFAIPLPALLAAIWYSVKGGLDAQRTQLFAASSILVMVLLFSITGLSIMTAYLPWGIVLEPQIPR